MKNERENALTTYAFTLAIFQALSKQNKSIRNEVYFQGRNKNVKSFIYNK